MVTASGLIRDVNGMINENGEVLRFKYYTASGATTGYDDDVAVVQSGNTLFTSGMIQPIKSAEGSFEARLLAQGKITTNDLRMYIPGSVTTSGSYVKIGIGSPTYNDYSIAEDGVENWNVGGTVVYKKVFAKFLTNGSFIGE